MAKQTVKQIANTAFLAARTASNLLSFLKSFKKEEKEFYLKKHTEILKELVNLIHIKEAKNTKAELVKEAKEIKVTAKKLAEYKVKADKIAACFNAGYSMGGSINVYLRNGKKMGETYAADENGKLDYSKKVNKLIDNTLLIGFNSDAKDYPRSSKYKATHSSHSIFLSVKEIEEIKVIGGIPTQILENKKIAKCISFLGIGNKHTYFIARKEQYITDNFHANTVLECENWRSQMAVRKLKERLSKKTMEEKIQIAKGKFIGLIHSTKVGNCVEGSLQFAKRHNLNPDFGYNLGYLLNIEPTNTFLLRLL